MFCQFPKNFTSGGREGAWNCAVFVNQVPPPVNTLNTLRSDLYGFLTSRYSEHFESYLDFLGSKRRYLFCDSIVDIGRVLNPQLNSLQKVQTLTFFKFSDIFRGYRNGTLAWNGLSILIDILKCWKTLLKKIIFLNRLNHCKCLEFGIK